MLEFISGGCKWLILIKACGSRLNEQRRAVKRPALPPPKARMEIDDYWGEAAKQPRKDAGFKSVYVGSFSYICFGGFPYKNYLIFVANRSGAGMVLVDSMVLLLQ